MFRRRASASARGGRASLRPALLLSARALIGAVAKNPGRTQIAPDGRPSHSPPRVPRWLAPLALSGCLLLLGGQPHAEQSPLAGPLTVSHNLTLSADVRVPPNGIGLEVTASDIRIDLNGHEIAGDGTGTGISINGQRGVIVTHGRIRGCLQGLTIDGGGKHQLTGLVVRGHGGNGIQIVNSNENTVTGCTILENARMGLLLQSASGNRIADNQFQRNRGPGDSGGITLEYSSANQVSGNTLQENGAWGLRLLEASQKNLIAGNTIKDTYLPVPAGPAQPGQPGVSWQPGLILNAGATGNEVRANVLTGNSFGLFLWGGAVVNRITANQATDNRSLDLLDLNKTCAVNTWSDNQFARANHFCDH
jgi:parallel beta-helix repeat protein